MAKQYYYLFDCMGLLFNGNITGLPDNCIQAEAFKDDAEAIAAAANYEATLIKYEYSDGIKTSITTLYEPQF